LSKFVNVYQTTLSKMNLNFQYADLRYPNGFAVRKPPGMVIKQATLKEDKAPAKPHPAAAGKTKV
jgi:cell division protein FtsQ